MYTFNLEPTILDHCLLNRLFLNFLNGDHENEDEESDEPIAHPEVMELTRQSKLRKSKQINPVQGGFTF